MQDAHARIGRVGVLAAGARGARRVEPDVLRPDFDIDILRLRQDGDRRRRGMDTAARLRQRYALHAVYARFELHPGEHALARHLGDDLLVATRLALALREDIDAPAM